MVGFVETGTFRIIDQASAPIAKINTALRQLEVTAQTVMTTLGRSAGGNMGALRQQSTQVNALASAYQKLAAAATAAANAMRGTGGLGSVGSTGSTGQITTQTNALNNQTRALARNTAATNSHNQAISREGRFALRHAAGAVGMNYHMAASSVEAAHLRDNGLPGVARIVGAAMAYEAVKHGFHHGAEMDTNYKQLGAMGWTKEQLGDDYFTSHGHDGDTTLPGLRRARTELSSLYNNVSENFVGHLAKDLTPIMGDVGHAMEALPSATAYVSAMQSFGIKGDHKQLLREAFAGVKSFEISTAPFTPEAMDKYLGNILSLKVAYGDQAKVNDYLLAQRAMGAAGVNMDKAARFGMMPALVQEFGSGAGVMIATAFRHVMGNKKYSKTEMGMMNRYGVLDGDKMVGSDKFQDNPFAFAADLARKVSEKDNLDLTSIEGRKKLQAVFGKMFGDRNTQKFMIESVFQWNKLVKDQEMVARIQADLEKIKRTGKVSFDTWEGAAAGVNAQLENLQTHLTGGTVGPAIGIANWAAGTLNRLSKNAKDDPLSTWMQIAGVSIGGAKMLGKGLEWVTGAGAMKAAAASHQNAAASLTSAAAALRGGAIGAHAPIGGTGAAVAAGAAGARVSNMGRVTSGLGKALTVFAAFEILDVMLPNGVMGTLNKWIGAEKGKRNPFEGGTDEQKTNWEKLTAAQNELTRLEAELGHARIKQGPAAKTERAELEHKVEEQTKKVIALRDEEAKIGRDADQKSALWRAGQILKEADADVTAHMDSLRKTVYDLDPVTGGPTQRKETDQEFADRMATTRQIKILEDGMMPLAPGEKSRFDKFMDSLEDAWKWTKKKGFGIVSEAKADDTAPTEADGLPSNMTQSSAADAIAAETGAGGREAGQTISDAMMDGAMQVGTSIAEAAVELSASLMEAATQLGQSIADATMTGAEAMKAAIEAGCSNGAAVLAEAVSHVSVDVGAMAVPAPAGNRGGSGQPRR